MKNTKKILLVVLAIATFTACTKTAKEDKGEENMEKVVDATDAMEDEADNVADATGEEEVVAGPYAWSSDLDNWVLSGVGSKSITLEGIAGEGDLSAEGRQQLDIIASILESNPSLNAVIKGHTTADQKIGNGKLRADWTRLKLIVGHDAVSERISTEGVGASELIEGLDANDPAQKRITVMFNK